MNNKQQILLDVESYQNYTLINFKSLNGSGYKAVAMYGKDARLTAEQKSIIQGLMRCRTTVGFNNTGYDNFIVQGALEDMTPYELWNVTKEIIEGDYKSWEIPRVLGIYIPTNWEVIDLMPVAFGKASLKTYAGRLHAPKLQDLPVPPNTELTPEQADELAKYCDNDCDLTHIVRTELDRALELRAKMSAEYNVNLMSKSDAQITEAIIFHKYAQLTGEPPVRNKMNDAELKRLRWWYTAPDFIRELASPALHELIDRIEQEELKLSAKGKVVLPKWIENFKFDIGGVKYQLGMGGLHSIEKCQYVEESDTKELLDVDVTGYYPSIILLLRLYPKNIGSIFLTILSEIKTTREAAKHTDIATSEILKIAINGLFGKLGDKYSTLFAPELMTTVTLTGQLSLLCLIERLTLIGCRVTSANTDGVTFLADRNNRGKVNGIVGEWELYTGFSLEETKYKLVAARDVNNYIAVTTSGKVKLKGIFTPTGIRKNPSFEIVKQAAMKSIVYGTPVEETIHECTDIRLFLKLIKVTGGGIWQGEPDVIAGKVVRFYKSTDGHEIRYANLKENQTQGNKVPESDNCRLCMELPDMLPADIDIDWYINEAKELAIECTKNVVQ